MPRRPRSNAASSSAAAANAATPTFTSFAAVTAQALGAHEEDANANITVTVTEWDAEALELLKKLNKRDATTRQRALDDLSAHLGEVPTDQPDVGTAFLSAWVTAFPTIVLEDQISIIRSKALSVTGAAVQNFGRATKPFLPTLLPVWVSAFGDSSPAVSDAASDSMLCAFASQDRQKKAALLYASHFRKFCSDAIVNYSNFKSTNSAEHSPPFVSPTKVLAVLQWLLDVSNDLLTITPIIDAEKDPFQMLCRATKFPGVNASSSITAIAHLAIDITNRTEFFRRDAERDSHYSRYEQSWKRMTRIGDLTLTLAKTSHKSAWDLVFVFLRETSGLTSTLRNDLINTISRAAASTSESALTALLPVAEALTFETHSFGGESVAIHLRRLLDPLRKRLYPESGDNISFAYATAVLPSYVEVLTFVLGIASQSCRCCVPPQKVFLSEWCNDFVGPICKSFVSGKIPLISADHVTFSARPNLREQILSSSKPPVMAQITWSFGKLLNALPKSELSKIIPELPPAIIFAMRNIDPALILLRLGNLLDAIEDASKEISILSEIITSATALTHLQFIQNSCRITAFALKRQVASNVTDFLCDARVINVWTITERMAKFGYDSLRRATEDKSLSDEIDKIRIDVASIFSWAIWSSQRCDKESYLTHSILVGLDDMLQLDQTFAMVSEIVKAHNHRRSMASFSPCAPLRGDSLESLVRRAIKILGSDEDMSPCTKDFLIATTSNNGGATVSSEIIQEVVRALLCRLAKVPEFEEVEEFSNFDPLILSLMTSPVQHLDHCVEDFDELTSSSIFRAPYSKEILSSIVARISSVTTKARAWAVVDHLIKKFVAYYHNSSRSKVEDLGFVFGEVAKASWEQDATLPVYLFSKLRLPGLTTFFCSFFNDVPFHIVFGDGSTTKVDVESLMETLRLIYNSNDSTMLDHLQVFLDALDDGSLRQVCLNVTELALQDPSPSIMRIFKLFYSTHDDQNMIRTAPLSAIAEKINEYISAVSFTNSNVGFAATRLVHFCVLTSKGKFLESAKDLLTNLTNMIRQDPSAPSGLIALDILSGSLGYHVELGSMEIIDWWKDLLSVVLLAVRRCLEQSRGLSKADIEIFEEHCACYVYHFAKGLGTGVKSDDVRFWVLRARDILEKLMHRLDAEGEAAISTGQERIAWIYNMSLALMDHIDDDDERLMMAADEISHWGAWIGIFCVPTIEPLRIHNAVDKQKLDFTQAKGEGWAGLTLRAAKREVLLGKQGEIRVKASEVYSLIPWLGCQSEIVRKAVIILVAHVATVDLPLRMEETFPENGLLDEHAEKAYVTRNVPNEIRNSLKWEDEFETTKEGQLAELKYFHTWRLFFDLIAGSDDDKQSSNVGEKCFRFVGISFLRLSPDFVSEFFERCAQALLKGSIIEQKAAILGAKDGLQVSERVREDINMAEEIRPGDIHVGRDEDLDSFGHSEFDIELEEEIGRTAGMAFAKALQRAPALSRSLYRDRIDRGTQSSLENFVKRWIAPLLIAEEIRKVKESRVSGKSGNEGEMSLGEGELYTHGSAAGREVRAIYSISDAFLEIGITIPEIFPLSTAQLEARSRVGMSEARWRKTLLEMTTLLQARDGSLAEAVGVWKCTLDKCFQGVDECPVCYSVLHLKTAALPEMSCRTCKNLFHADCLYKWFSKSNSRNCPLCRSII